MYSHQADYARFVRDGFSYNDTYLTWQAVNFNLEHRFVASVAARYQPAKYLTKVTDQEFAFKRQVGSLRLRK